MASFTQLNWRTKVAVEWSANVNLQAFFKGAQVSEGGIESIRSGRLLRATPSAIARRRKKWKCFACQHLNSNVITSTGEGDICTTKDDCESCGHTRVILLLNGLILWFRFDGQTFNISLFQNRLTLDHYRHSRSDADVVAALWTYVRPFAHKQEAVRFTIEPLTYIGLTALHKVSLWNSRISLSPSRTDPRLEYTMDCLSSVPVCCYTVDETSGAARVSLQTQEFAPLVQRRRSPKKPRPRFYVRPPSAKPGASLSHIGTEDDLKHNYERFVAACDLFQHAATQIQRLWRGVRGRDKARQERKVYYAPDGPGYRQAKAHFAEVEPHSH